MRELRAAIFDLGGVLTTPIFESFLAFEAALGLPDHTLIRTFGRASEPGGDPDYFLLERGEITEAEFYGRLAGHIADEMGTPFAFPGDPSHTRQELWRGIRKNDQMIDAVIAIAKTYKTALLTNNVKEWSDWRDHYPLDIFDAFIDSWEVGMRKPEPRIFHLTCERLGVEPHEAAFVDDIIGNVEAAQALGMTAIHFTSNDAVLAQLREHFPRAFEEAAAL